MKIFVQVEGFLVIFSCLFFFLSEQLAVHPAVNPLVQQRGPIKGCSPPTRARVFCECVTLNQTQPCSSYESRFFTRLPALLPSHSQCDPAEWKGGREAGTLHPSLQALRKPGLYSWLGWGAHDRIRYLGHRTNWRSAGSSGQTRARFSPCKGRTLRFIKVIIQLKLCC